jgi:membrane-bound lytic murein transglycosylase D
LDLQFLRFRRDRLKLINKRPEVRIGSARWIIFVLGIMVGAALSLTIVHIAEQVNPDQTTQASLDETSANPFADYPIPINDRIRARIRYYLRPDRTADLLESYQRSGKYLPMISAILADYKLPQFLIYLPIIESRFLSGVRSRSGAVGLWQIMPGTALEYGLRMNRWIDERRDPEKSTIVAAEYLRFLFDRFGDWDVVLAAYNCGFPKIVRAMRRERTSSFWHLRTLPKETRNFVPKFYAVLHILTNAGEYGITLPQRHPPIDYETIEIEAALSIEQIAELANVSPSLIRSLNPALIAEIVPGDKYSIRVPPGAKDSFLKQFKQNSFERLHITYTTYRVKKGDTLYEIAKKFGTTVRAIRAENHLRSVRWIDVGMELKIARVSVLDNDGTDDSEEPVSAETVSRIKLNYKSQKDGVSLNTLARYYAVEVDQIRAWNTWLKHDSLRKGEDVIIYKSKDELTFHKIRRGDSLWRLARKYHTSVSYLKRWNQLRSSTIHPGDRLIVGMR